jgi:small subunit ribosomal protein S21
MTARKISFSFLPTEPTASHFQSVMPEVIVRKGEPVDRALKRLKNKLDSEGIMDEVRRLRAFETPTQKNRRKAKANAKRGKVKFRFNPNPPVAPAVPAVAPTI